MTAEGDDPLTTTATEEVGNGTERGKLTEFKRIALRACKADAAMIYAAATILNFPRPYTGRRSRPRCCRPTRARPP